ncbi:MAG: D-alanine--D-alanine ligase [Bacteroidetes bacterium]|nr:D-alanine--D-alanine ligase [Bacteroidota bacterium]
MHVAVLYGGTSSERNVSLASGTAIGQALQKLGHQVTFVDAADGKDSRVSFSGVGETPPGPDELQKPPADSQPISDLISTLTSRHVQIVFNALHGGAGEDGRLQAVLDLAGLKYTGSGVLASSVAMNKVAAKRIFLSVGVPTAEYLFFKSGVDVNSVRNQVKEFGIPFVVKPNEEGSTVGLSIVHDMKDFDSAWSTAVKYGDLLIERYIDGRELTVAILGEEALPVIEIIPEGGFYDYHHKYTKGMTQYVCPAELDSDVAQEAQTHALRAFHALACKGYARVDFRLSPHGNLYCLEVNTLPGMTETSLVPKAAKAAGMEFEQLVDRIIELSLANNR